MQVFKFGGASVKDADAVQNLKKIVSGYNQDLVIVVSAMGKMTNAFEKVCNSFFYQSDTLSEDFQYIKLFHNKIIKDLFPNDPEVIKKEIEAVFNKINSIISGLAPDNYCYLYDQIVSCGEILSSTIISAYLDKEGVKNQYIDIRENIITDDQYQKARVLWNETEKNLKKCFSFKNQKLYITQGFVGGTKSKKSTTLGREGSDYTAAIIANILEADSVTVWKDVPGLLNADPKWFDNTLKISNISYREAIELSYYGATVIHPKTIKPLENKNIPLYVKSFLDPKETGSVIDKNTSEDSKIPSFIFRVNQVLISIAARDLSFIIEENLSEIFKIFADYKVCIHLMQTSAVNFSVCVDDHPIKIKKLIEKLQESYRVLYNNDVELATIRHYNQETIDRVLTNKKVFLEQRTRFTTRYVIKELD